VIVDVIVIVHVIVCVHVSVNATVIVIGSPLTIYGSIIQVSMATTRPSSSILERQEFDRTPE
jgi:hypothetical protein